MSVFRFCLGNLVQLRSLASLNQEQWIRICQIQQECRVHVSNEPISSESCLKKSKYLEETNFRGKKISYLDFFKIFTSWGGGGNKFESEEKIENLVIDPPTIREGRVIHRALLTIVQYKNQPNYYRVLYTKLFFGGNIA